MSNMMTKAEFARLCQVSQAMVSKYSDALVIVGSKVDAARSLANIEGRLDHAKWKAAKERLSGDGAGTSPAGAPAPSNVVSMAGQNADSGGAPDGSETEEPQGWKAREQMYRALTAEKLYHEQIGALVPADEIAHAVESVIADFWTETERAVKIQAAEIASELGLDADQASKLRTLILGHTRDMRSNFARVCRNAAAHAGGAEEAVA